MENEVTTLSNLNEIISRFEKMRDAIRKRNLSENDFRFIFNIELEGYSKPGKLGIELNEELHKEFRELFPK